LAAEIDELDRRKNALEVQRARQQQQQKPDNMSSDDVTEEIDSLDAQIAFKQSALVELKQSLGVSDESSGTTAEPIQNTTLDQSQLVEKLVTVVAPPENADEELSEFTRKYCELAVRLKELERSAQVPFPVQHIIHLCFLNRDILWCWQAKLESVQAEAQQTLQRAQSAFDDESHELSRVIDEQRRMISVLKQQAERPQSERRDEKLIADLRSQLRQRQASGLSCSFPF
jgi:hypothetical protein